MLTVSPSLNRPYPPSSPRDLTLPRVLRAATLMREWESAQSSGTFSDTYVPAVFSFLPQLLLTMFRYKNGEFCHGLCLLLIFVRFFTFCSALRDEHTMWQCDSLRLRQEFLIINCVLWSPSYPIFVGYLRSSSVILDAKLRDSYTKKPTPLYSHMLT